MQVAATIDTTPRRFAARDRVNALLFGTTQPTIEDYARAGQALAAYFATHPASAEAGKVARAVRARVAALVA